MKFGVADYGMNQWDGGCFDLEQRLLDLRSIGYEGLERLGAASGEEAMANAAVFHRLGMDFGTVRGPEIHHNIQWTCALGKSYIWTQVLGKDFDRFCRQVNRQVGMAAKWGVKVGLHNHLGSLVESQQELEAFLANCPGAGLILDTAHLAAADGDCHEIVAKYADRLVAVHLKDWLVTNPEIGLERWPQRGRFCELGAGNIGLDNATILQKIVVSGYDGWVFVEHDTHLRDPLLDLAVSREYIRQAGY
ncbi:MAG: sugar phosphate isomerase/epimerase [Victivallales bacterium]|jgi:sugar phosphate isomerase/epimerase|nr:sugar phosphate isomerase/epimerase [Victivallales bacterium]